MAPSITFISDIFHPLVTPLTTYTYTTGSLSSDTVSATDEERLPPGGFSLRHGFPFWFGKAQQSIVSSEASSGKSVPSDEEAKSVKACASHLNSTASVPIIQAQNIPLSKGQDAFLQQPSASIKEVLDYVKCTFEDEPSLDALPLEAAGNPGAWNAWRSHRKSILSSRTSDPSLLQTSNSRQGGRTATGGTIREHLTHEEWSWEGVWEERVQRGIQSSISDAVLYGNIDRGDTLVCSKGLWSGSEGLTFLLSDKLRRDQ